MYEYPDFYCLSNNLTFIPSQITTALRKNNFEIERDIQTHTKCKICALLSYWICILTANKNFLLQVIANFVLLIKSAFSLYSGLKTNIETHTKGIFL